MMQSRGSVLVIDDDAVIRTLLVRTLTDLGFHVKAAETGTAGIAAARAQRFDLALTDLSMPGMDGVETLEQLKHLDPDLQVIVVTANATIDSAIACLKRGAVDYVEKPFALEDIQLTVENAMEKGHLRGVVSLYQASTALYSIRDTAELLRTVPSLGERLLKADSVALVDGPVDSGRCAVHRYGKAFPPSESLLRGLAVRGEAAATPLLLSLSEPTVPALEQADGVYGSVVVLPLRARETSFGVLVLLRKVQRPPFTTSEVQRASLLADTVCLALDNSRLHQELEAKLGELSIVSSNLSQLERQSRAILDNAPHGIVTIDVTGILIDMNLAAEQIFAAPASHWLGRSLSHFLRQDGSVADLPTTFWNCFPDVATVVPGRRVEIVARLRSGVELPVELAVAAVPCHNGVTYSVFLHDLSHRRKLEIELGHAQKLESVGMLASGIAHELNTPIQFLGDNAHFLKDSCERLQALVGKYQGCLRAPLAEERLPKSVLDDLRHEEEKADLEFLQQEIPRSLAQTLDGVARVATIVRAMKNFAHPDGLQKAPADLNEALRSTLTVARNEVKYVAEVAMELGDLPPVTCHVGDLNQVFLNLLVNAAHAIGEVVRETGRRGQITVRTKQEGDSVIVVIEDTGSGISPAIQPRIFDPFFTTKEVGKGTGQGLAIARNIVVEKHGGSLTFQTTVGKGTAFFVRLPIEGVTARPAGIAR